MKSKFNGLLIIVLLIAFAGCNKAKKQAKEDETIIKDYIAKHKLNAQKTEEGIYYIIEKTGTPPHPTINSTVEVEYKGTFLDGSIFDETDAGKPISFPLRNVIKGWQIGIPLFQVGGEGILIIPSAYAYGPSGSGGIPANEVLRFDIKLYSVKE